MRGIKAICLFLFGAGYASSWWAAAMFGDVLWLIPTIYSVAVFVPSLIWLQENWSEEAKR